MAIPEEIINKCRDIFKETYNFIREYMAFKYKEKSDKIKNIKEAKKIAQQHLNENPRYYCVLHRIGLIEGADVTNLARKTCPSI